MQVSEGEAIKPVVSVIFGNLTNYFLNLQVAFRLSKVDGSMEQANIAAAAFKHSVSSNAARMTYIGEEFSLSTAVAILNLE